MRLGLLLLWLLGMVHAQADGARYTFDPVHSRIQFTVDHLGYSRSTGWFPRWAGEIWFDPDQPAATRVQVRIDTAAVEFGHAAWNRRMRGRSYFDVQRFPLAIFESTRVEVLADALGVLHGELELLGVRLPLAIPYTLNRHAVHRYTGRTTLGVSAVFTLQRSAWGMDTALRDVGDEVRVTLEIEAVRENRRPVRAPGKS